MLATSFIVYIRTSEIQMQDMVAYLHNKPLYHGNANAIGESHHPGHWLRLRLRFRLTKNKIKNIGGISQVLNSSQVHTNENFQEELVTKNDDFGASKCLMCVSFCLVSEDHIGMAFQHLHLPRKESLSHMPTLSPQEKLQKCHSKAMQLNTSNRQDESVNTDDGFRASGCLVSVMAVAQFQKTTMAFHHLHLPRKDSYPKCLHIHLKKQSQKRHSKAMQLNTSHRHVREPDLQRDILRQTFFMRV